MPPRCQSDKNTRGRENTTYDTSSVFIYMDYLYVLLLLLPCGSSAGTASDPQTADTPPAPEQCLDIHQKLLHKAASSNTLLQGIRFFGNCI